MVPRKSICRVKASQKDSILCLGRSCIVIEFNNGQSKNERNVIVDWCCMCHLVDS